MSRSYTSVKPKIHRVYSVEEALSLFRICRNTLSNWVGTGLTPTGGKGPHLFRGAELKRFHDARNTRQKHELRVGEFKCLGCGNAVFPELETVLLTTSKTVRLRAEGSCPDCGAHVIKFLNATECDRMRQN